LISGCARPAVAAGARTARAARGIRRAIAIDVVPEGRERNRGSDLGAEEANR